MTPADHVALLYLDDARILRIDPGNTGSKKHPVAPVLNSRDEQ
jgi:hypothetical protein